MVIPGREESIFSGQQCWREGEMDLIFRDTLARDLPLTQLPNGELNLLPG